MGVRDTDVSPSTYRHLRKTENRRTQWCRSLRTTETRTSETMCYLVIDSWTQVKIISIELMKLDRTLKASSEGSN